MSAENTSSTVAWSTGVEQTQVKLVDADKTYSVDADIAKRMGITQGTSTPLTQGSTESPFELANCSSQDFESALAFCAQDRASAEPPSKELAHIIAQTTPAESESESEETAGVQAAFAGLTFAEDEDEEESYAPSESEASDSGEEYSDVDPTDVGTTNIEAEREEHEAKAKEKAVGA